jgi:hypothetical protein
VFRGGSGGACYDFACLGGSGVVLRYVEEGLDKGFVERISEGAPQVVCWASGFSWARVSSGIFEHGDSICLFMGSWGCGFWPEGVWGVP